MCVPLAGRRLQHRHQGGEFLRGIADRVGTAGKKTFTYTGILQREGHALAHQSRDPGTHQVEECHLFDAETPLAAQSWGYILVAVKPGSVLISLMNTS